MLGYTLVIRCVSVLPHIKIVALFRCSHIFRYSLCFGALAYQDTRCVSVYWYTQLWGVFWCTHISRYSAFVILRVALSKVTLMVHPINL